MGRTRLVSRPVGTLGALLFAAFACSTETSSMPPPSGDCIPVDGGPPCKAGGTAGGSPSGPGGGDSGVDGSELEGGALGCGTADSLLAVMNTSCLPCIQTNCCAADQACTGACLTLLRCMANCLPQNSASCTSACNGDAVDQSVASAYTDFADCLMNATTGCSPECPTLAQISGADF